MHDERSDPINSTSTSLLSRVRDHDPEAWQRLVQLYGPMVYGWARQAGAQPADSADITQDVFHSVTVHIGRFHTEENGGGFRGWLWTIARNKIRDHYRQLRGKPQAMGGTAAMDRINELPASPADPASKSGTLEVDRLKLRALELVRDDFEDRTWQAFWRATIQGEAPADIAEDLGVTVWTVYKARARVLRRLRDELDGLT